MNRYDLATLVVLLGVLLAGAVLLLTVVVSG